MGDDMELNLADPKGLVRESYAIDGITLGECRSIFLDWALSLAPGTTPHDAMRLLIAHYGQDRPDHPMTSVLGDGLAAPEHPQRRGGRAARLGYVRDDSPT
jgi:hypothetical protein